MHHQQRRVNDTLAIGRHVRQTIDRLIDGGISIDVSTEVHTDGLKIIDDALTGEVLGTIEGHMLQEVSQTILMILFEDRTYTLRDMEFAALLRLLVMTNIIG